MAIAGVNNSNSCQAVTRSDFCTTTPKRFLHGPSGCGHNRWSRRRANDAGPTGLQGQTRPIRCTAGWGPPAFMPVRSHCAERPYRRTLPYTFGWNTRRPASPCSSSGVQPIFRHGQVWITYCRRMRRQRLSPATGPLLSSPVATGCSLGTLRPTTLRLSVGPAYPFPTSPPGSTLSGKR